MLRSNMATQNHWTRVANHVKNKITERTINNEKNRLSGSKLLADMKKGQCLSKWDPELCIKMLQLPGVDNYLAIKKLIQKANKEWIVEFLERDGLGTLLDSLRTIGGKSLTDTIAQLQCVECLRAVVRSRTGLHYISTHLEYSSNLASVMICNNTIVKLQVYELLCALCVFSTDGMVFVKSVLSHIKMNQGSRHDYEIVVTELQQADTFAYQTTLMAFINCLILVEQNLKKRIRVRNELLALGLRPVIDNMAGYEDEVLQIQLTVFAEHQVADESQAPQMSHQELLNKLRYKISNTLYDSYLQNILLRMSEMDYSDTKINDIWNLINEVVCNDPQKILNMYRKTSKTHSAGCQTNEKRLNKLLSSNVRRHSLDVTKNKCPVVVPKSKRLSLPSVGGSTGNGSSAKGSVKKSIQCSISTQTEHACNCDGRAGHGEINTELNNNRLSSPDANPGHGCTDVCPAPFVSTTTSPALPPTSFPPHPEILLTPQLPNLSENRLSPLLPTASGSIPPPPPPLPTLSGSIPPPPPLPSTLSGSVPPPPPPLTLYSGIPLPPPPPPALSGSIPPPPPPPLPVLSGSTPQPSLPVPAPPPPPPFAGPAIPPTESTFPLSPSSALSKMSISELGQKSFTVQEITDGRRTVPTRRMGNNIKYYSLPKNKMKVLNWTKVDVRNFEKSVWSSNPKLPNLTINFVQIEELFCQKPRTKTSPAALSSTGGVSKANVLNILDSKRSLAINIMLKQFKSGSDEIIDNLRNGKSIPIEKLKGLQRILPTDDEIKMIKKQESNSTTMGTAELFCLNLNSVSSFRLRIKLMIEKEELPVAVKEIYDQLDRIKNMCNNLIMDYPFKQFLSLVLLVGNYLNAGSYAGNASGFTLDTLPKLLDTRANKPRVTFLHFIVEVAQNNKNEMLSFTKYISDLRSLSRISFSPSEGATQKKNDETLSDEIKNINEEIRKLHSELSEQKEKQIINQFSDFIKQVKEDIKKINEEYKNTTEAIENLAIYFGENVKKFKIEECFALLGNFFERIDMVAKENTSRRIQEEKNKLLAIKLETEKSTDSPKIKSRPRGTEVTKEEDVCIVDLVLQEIRRGSFNLRSVKSQGEKRI